MRRNASRDCWVWRFWGYQQKPRHDKIYQEFIGRQSLRSHCKKRNCRPKWTSRKWSDKGQLISKANCQAVNSSKKWTNEFVFTSMRSFFARFLEEIEDSKKAFWNHLTFSVRTKKLHKVGLTFFLKFSWSNSSIWKT